MTRLQLYGASCSSKKSIGAMWWWGVHGGGWAGREGGSEERVEQHVPLAPLAPLSPLALLLLNASQMFLFSWCARLLQADVKTTHRDPRLCLPLLPNPPQSLYLRAVMIPLLCFFGRMWFFTVPLTASTFHPQSRAPLLSRRAATQTHLQHVLLC